jgi:hypothetical protein
LEQKAFDLIVSKVGEALSAQGYTSAGSVEEKEGHAALFTSENSAYSVLYNIGKKRFELRSCDADDGKPDGKWKSASIWLFDPDENVLSDAESIANDFVETIQGPKRVAEMKSKKRRKKDDDYNVDPPFFFNRFVGIFPELRDEINQEKITYGKLRAVTFARASLLPRLDSLCSNRSQQDAIKRCGDLLNDQYNVGDMDVRSIITIVLLNGLSDAALENLKPMLSDDLKKSHVSALKLKGKKIRPEKKKKQKRFVAENLNTLNR